MLTVNGKKVRYLFCIFATFKDVLQSRTANIDVQHLARLRANIDELIATGKRECENVLSIDNDFPEVVNCIIYYVTDFLSRKMKMVFSCSVCSDSQYPRAKNASGAALTNSKMQCGVVHPN